MKTAFNLKFIPLRRYFDYESMLFSGKEVTYYGEKIKILGIYEVKNASCIYKYVVAIPSEHETNNIYDELRDDILKNEKIYNKLRRMAIDEK